ncbi:MAG: hypothetical protein IJZ53_09275 [Tyzzerella sp.]|nr:hypothetical protein [Tyzzerella sp.]
MDEKRKQNSDKKKLFLVLGILVAVAILLGVIALVKIKKDDDAPVTKLPSSNTEIENKVEALTTYELLNDPLAKGYIGEGVNTSSFPKDAVWKRLQASKIPLKIGESYIETFDREYFDTRLRAQTMGNGVTAELSSKDSLRAGTGNSLIIDSEIGIYTGVYLKGMRFSANGIYQVEFDYKIIKESDDFFFQFRADSDGKSGVRTGDKFVTIKGQTGATGSIRWVAQLDNFQDYGIMIFPRNKAGKIAIDNIKITRLAENYNELAVGNTIKEDFDGTMYFELDKELVPNSGFVTGDKAIEGRSLYIESDKEYQCIYLKGFNFISGEKYRIKFDYVINDPTSNFYVQMISKSGEFKQFYSFGDGTVATKELRSFDRIFEIGGDEKEYLLQIFPGAGNEKSGITIDNIEVTRMSSEWPVFTGKTPTKEKAVVENFENGLYKGHLLASQHNTGLYNIVKDESNVLQITIPDQFSGVEFVDGLKLTKGQKYKVSFDYKVVKNPSLGAFYVQFTGGVDYGQLIDLTEGKAGNYETMITAGNANDEEVALQMFGNQPGMVINIDNLKIIVADEESIPKDIELNVGDKYVNDFDDNNRLVLDTGSVPNTKVESNDNTIDGNSLIFNSDGEYKCVYINGITLDGKGIYRVRFDYKVMERQDIFYFQFVSKSGAYTSFMSFGDGTVPLNSMRTFDQIFVLNTEEEVLMQMFPGAAKGNNSVIVDNFTIERLDPESPVFEQKNVTEDSSITENFETGLYGGSITPNQQGTGTFSIVEGFDGKGLEVVVPDAFSGVQFKNGVKFETGEKYNIFFDYKITENPNNAAFYVQIGGVDYEEVSAVAGSTGSVMTTLTVGSANGNPEVLQLFANQAGLKMIIDNIRIEKFVTPTTPFDENFNEIPLYNWAPNNGGIVNLTSVTGKLPSAGDGNALYVNCVSIYDGVIMTPIHTAVQSGQSYDISFDIKALNVPANAGLYIQSGNFVLVPIVAGMDERVEVTLTAQAEFIQLFTSVGGLEFTIDNWSIKPHVEQGVFEDFEDFNALNVVLSPNNGGQFSESSEVPDAGSGKGLYINCVNAFDGIQVVPKEALVLGDKYVIKMKYRIVNNPNGSILYIQYGSNFQSVDAAPNSQGTYEVQLVAETTDVLQMFSSVAGLELVIDDLSIERVTSGVFFANFDTANNFIVNPNNEATISSCFNPNLRPNGATNNSLMVTSQSAYGGVILVPQNFTMEAGKDYRLSFRYKIIENLINGPLYIQLGAGQGSQQLNSEAGHSELVNITLKAAENLIQIFGGSEPGIKFTIDDFVIEPKN